MGNAIDESESVSLADELRPILLRLARHLRSEIPATGLTAGQIAILVAIEFNPGMTSQKLADREGLSAAGVSGHLARLEGKGLIRRERTGDGRRVALTLSPAGRDAIELVRRERTRWLQGRIELLTPAEREQVRACLQALDRISMGDR